MDRDVRRVCGAAISGGGSLAYEITEIVVNIAHPPEKDRGEEACHSTCNSGAEGDEEGEAGS